MNVQAVSFTSNLKIVDSKNNKIETVSRFQYKTQAVTDCFFVGGLTGYTILNILNTNNILKKIDELPKGEIIKNVNKSFKKNIKWGLLSGAASTVVGYFWFNFTEAWQKKMMVIADSYDAESKALKAQLEAQKQLNAALIAGDENARKAALEKYNAAGKEAAAIKAARQERKNVKAQKSVQVENPVLEIKSEPVKQQ